MKIIRNIIGKMETSKVLQKIKEMTFLRSVILPKYSKARENRSIDRQRRQHLIPANSAFVVASVESRSSSSSSSSADCAKDKQGKMAKYRIVMVRHGESEWNQLNLFCGWFDAGLSEKGKSEALAAGKALKEAGYKFDIAHTSMLTRAQNTLQTILKEIGQENIPIAKTWRLNERHYGGLTGMNKAETAAKYGEEQVQIWRRSFDTPPPPMQPDHKYYDVIVKDERYKGDPKPEEFPMFESLKLTIERTLPYWNGTIIPQLKEGKQIIIAAHGNSLRGIVKHLDEMSNDQIMGLNLPTGIPFVYELDENFKPVVSMKFLGDEETVKAAIAAVAAQGKAK